MPSMKVIGRYEIKSEIARGGMATVYHAYDPRFERDVAIKVLPQAMLHDPQFRVRFEREAKMIALLEHPAIVPVYDFGEDAGQPYIVMRYMSGGSLTERLHTGRLNLVETSQIISRLAPALDAAHARGIIHRDLKPGNILFDQYGNAYLSDFGIARLTESGQVATITGDNILGTPGYMSPEQVQGDKAIDGRSDLYSLGVLIYHMLVGETPYRGDSPAKVMMMHVLQPVPIIRDARSDLPQPIEPFISRSMAKKPEERFATAGDMAARLENVVRQATGVAPQASPVQHPEPPISGRPDYKMMTVATAGETVVSPDKTRVSSPTNVSVPPASPARPPAGGLSAAVPAGAGAAGGAVPVGALPKKRSIAPLAIASIAVLVVMLAAIGLLAGMGRSGIGPLAAVLAPPTATHTLAPTLPPTATNNGTGSGVLIDATATNTATLPPTTGPTDTPAATTPAGPSETPTQSASPTTVGPALPSVGGADMIAYFNKNEVWVANIDGSNAYQLTTDGTPKLGVQFTPDGQAVNYISGKCVYTVKLADKSREILTCFNFVQDFQAFNISPDGTQVAASLENQVYVLPYDIAQLRSITVKEDLVKLAKCPDFAPYARYRSEYAIWSRDGHQLGMVIWGAAQGIGTADTVHVISLDNCSPNPDIIANWPPPFFMPEEYKLAPMIPDFGWDGLKLYALATWIRNQGFGKLYLFNETNYKAQGPIKAISECCYRDPVFTPDGQNLLFAYQKYPSEDTNIYLYLVTVGSLGTGEAYTPLPLPPIDGKSQPLMTFRMAK